MEQYLASYGVRFEACCPEHMAAATVRIAEVIEEALEMEFDTLAVLTSPPHLVSKVSYGR